MQSASSKKSFFLQIASSRRIGKFAECKFEKWFRCEVRFQGPIGTAEDFLPEEDLLEMKYADYNDLPLPQPGIGAWEEYFAYTIAEGRTVPRITTKLDCCPPPPTPRVVLHGTTS